MEFEYVDDSLRPTSPRPRRRAGCLLGPGPRSRADLVTESPTGPSPIHSAGAFSIRYPRVEGACFAPWSHRVRRRRNCSATFSTSKPARTRATTVGRISHCSVALRKIGETSSQTAGSGCANELACKPDPVPRAERGVTTIHLGTPLPGTSSGSPADSGEQPSNVCATALERIRVRPSTLLRAGFT